MARPRYGRWWRAEDGAWWHRPTGTFQRANPVGRPPFHTVVLTSKQEAAALSVHCTCRMEAGVARLCEHHAWSNHAEGVRIALRRDSAAVRRHFQLRGSE